MESDKDNEEPEEAQSSLGRSWKKKSKLYVCHLLSSWGDRMWTFAVGLYMMKLYPDSLKLTAIYGITVSASIIIFGSFIGAWIDRTFRIRAARVALLTQNTNVAVCALFLLIVLTFNNRLQEYAYWAKPLSQAVIVFVADVAALASQASHIILSRDWIVVISAGDRALLSSYNSVMRAIDLGSNILAPSSVGFVMSLMSAKSAAVFLSAWNIVSMAIEYMLLTNIYKSFPDLAVKSLATDNQESFFSPDGSVEDQSKIEKRSGSSEWLNSWLSYFNHEVFSAAFGLSLLYMTVLGFDHVTTAYAYSQGVEPWELGMFSSAGALVGMAGALSFPFLTAKLGLHRTGILGFTSEALMLSACLLSIFLRGSPFKYLNVQDELSVGSSATIKYDVEILGSTSGIEETCSGCLVTTQSPFSSLSVAHANGTLENLTNPPNSTSLRCTQRNYSILFYLGGIIAARFGLWIADLSVTQVMQERVAEDKRGIINGLQSSMNQVLNLLKFVLVAVIPDTDLFGFLIIASYCFTCFGCLSFGYYCLRNRTEKFSAKDVSKDPGENVELQSNAQLD